MTRCTSLSRLGSRIVTSVAALALVAMILSAGSHKATAQSASLTQTPAPAGPVTQDKAYVISPNDQLDIGVQGHPEVSQTVLVLPDGTFSYPIVGMVRAGGCTIAQLTRLLTEGLSVQLNEPDVTVSVHQRGENEVSVLGSVKTPGKVVLKDGWRVLDAIAACGGLSVAKPEYVNATLVHNGTQVSPIDMVALMSNADSTQNLLLAPNDVVLLQDRNPESVQIEVLGEVAKPGFEPVPNDGSINTLLIAAGGPTAKAALSHSEIIRQGKDIPVDLRDFLTKGQVLNSIKVEAGDTVVVPQNRNLFAVFGEVKSPGYLTYPDDQQLTVLKALSAAGSVTAEANLSNVTVVRPGPTPVDKPTVMTVNVGAMLKDGDLSKDILVQPSDLVYVPSRKHGFSLGQALQYLNPMYLLAPALHL